MNFCKKIKKISPKFSKLFFYIFRLARRALLLGPKGPIVCSRRLQELEKAARRAALFLVLLDSLAPQMTESVQRLLATHGPCL